MPVSTTSSISEAYFPNGVTTAFPFAFKAASVDEVVAIDADGSVISTSLYTVALGEGEGGTLNFIVAPAADDIPVLYVASEPLLTQPANFDNSGPSFNPASLTRALDRAAVRDLRQQRDIDRSPKVPIGAEGFSIPTLDGADGKALGVIDGQTVWVPNDATTAAELLGDVQEVAQAVDADQQQVATDKITVAADKGLTIGYRNQAEGYKNLALTYATAAEAYSDGSIFDTTAEGVDPVDGVADTKPFLVPNGDGNLALWRNVGGVATPIGSPQFVSTSGAFLAAAVADVESAAATVGIETGSTQSRGGIGGVQKGGVKLLATTYFDIAVKAQIANEFLSLPQMLMRRTGYMTGHSAVAASGAVAGATVNPRSGINGGPGRSLEYTLRRISPDWRVIARGTSAQSGPNVAQRTGGLPTLITLDGGATTLAAAGAVGCTCAPDSGPSMRRGQAVESYYGKVNGVPCILKCTGGPNANSPVYTIEQLNGTATIPLTPGTAFFLNADLLDYAINIFWMTQNDTNVQVSLDAVRAAVGKLPKPARYIVIGDWPFSLSVDGIANNGSWDIGTPEHTRMLQKNAALREEWKSDFLDPYALFRNEYPYNGAMYRSLAQFTGEADTLPSYDYLAADDWRSRGLIPRRWMGVHEGGVDYTHNNSQAYQQISFACRDLHFRPKGWLDL